MDLYVGVAKCLSEMNDSEIDRIAGVSEVPPRTHEPVRGCRFGCNICWVLSRLRWRRPPSSWRTSPPGAAFLCWDSTMSSPACFAVGRTTEWAGSSYRLFTSAASPPAPTQVRPPRQWDSDTFIKLNDKPFLEVVQMPSTTSISAKHRHV